MLVNYTIDGRTFALQFICESEAKKFQTSMTNSGIDSRAEEEYLFVKVSFKQDLSGRHYSYVAPNMKDLQPHTCVCVEVLEENLYLTHEYAYVVSSEMKSVSELRRIAAPFGGKLRKVVSLA